MKIGRTCCFIGHPPQELNFKFDETHWDCIHLKELLVSQIYTLITSYQIQTFYSGMDLGCDQFAAEAVLSLKHEFPQIRLECILPCETQHVKWNELQRDRFFYILEHCDTESMLQYAYTPDCIEKRNVYMIDHSDIVLAVWNSQPGEISRAISYAYETGKFTIVVDPDTFQVKPNISALKR